MRINVLKQNIKDQVVLDKGLSLAKQLCATIGLTLDFTQFETTKQFTSLPFSNETNSNGYCINGTEIFIEGKSKQPADLYLLIYDWDKITPKPTNPAEIGLAISIPIQWYAGHAEVLSEYILHEISHFFFQGSGKKDLTHLKYDPIWKGVFNQKSNETYYLFLLKDFVTMPTYKYFKPSEIVGLKPELVEMLDKAREIAGVPFVIGSGLRTQEHNKEVGGVENSAHLTGEATDIKCPNSVNRLKMLKAFIQVGFNRIGIGKDFIHVDISKTLPNEVCWTYYK